MLLQDHVLLPDPSPPGGHLWQRYVLVGSEKSIVEKRIGCAKDLRASKCRGQAVNQKGAAKGVEVTFVEIFYRVLKHSMFYGLH